MIGLMKKLFIWLKHIDIYIILYLNQDILTSLRALYSSLVEWLYALLEVNSCSEL